MKLSWIYRLMFLLVVFFSLIAGSCKKTATLTSGGILRFSNDTLKFDTVFTAAGSYTNWVLIYNPQGEEVVLSNVKLSNGTNSYFHLNVDGVTGNYVANVRIAAHDSVYVFATVNIDPTNENSPFLITDNLVATLNGKDFSIPFTAYGQNAHYIIDSSLSTNTTWGVDKPYVIIYTGDTSKARGLQINPGATLTLGAGCRVYMHQNANITVFGNLVANGTKKDSVIFQGDRIDRAYFGYKGYPGEWGGLYIDSKSKGSKLTYTILKNCGNGSLGIPAAIWLAADSVRDISNPQLTLDRTVIENSIGYGIYSYNGSIVASNCLIHTTAQQALAVTRGGSGNFTNCTFANYGSSAVTHSNAGTVALLDYYWDGVSGHPVYYSDIDVKMKNCIVYGSLDSELICDTTGTPAGISTKVSIENCLVKMGSVREPFVDFASVLFNQDPLFKNTANGDFHIGTNSPAYQKGASVSTFSTDLDGNNWASPFDIGCYKAQ